ncbi:hypothetical protein [Micromonospora sp. NPDC005173]|uniref:hypothetical protein n=1 Tax=Micromonospora sp. NPDC005173 TaxID=3157165 RepID=UPI0033BEA279
MAGDADGEGRFAGYPFLPGGSTRFPDAEAVLRSYAHHEVVALLFVTDGPDAVEGVVLEEPDPERDEMCFTVHNTTWTGIDGYRQCVDEAQMLAAQHGRPVSV